MPGIRPVFEKGPITYLATTVANGGNITGGQLVMPDGTTGKIKPTSGAVANCLGVALGDASGSDFANTDTTDTWGNPIVNAQYPPNEVAVAYQGVYNLTATAAAIPFGALVTSAAAGKVVAYAAAAAGAVSVDGTIIGRCVEPGGIASGGTGRILLGGVGA